LVGSWVLIWKFPADLNNINGFCKLTIPVPVGNYPLIPDEWSIPTCNLDDIRVDEDYQLMEKFRINSMHYLKAENGEKFAMISSSYFIKQFWDIADTEIEVVNSLLTDLANNCGICGFACWGQHHAIVFYIDLLQNVPMTPRQMANALADPKRNVAKVLIRHTEKKEDMGRWLRGYTEYFNS